MSDCIFCNIASGQIPAKLVYEDDQIAAFHDLEPQAPVHVLIIPKKHIDSLDHMNPEDAGLIGHLMNQSKDIARELGIETGYRVVSNCGPDALQSVQHLHFHLLGKRRMSWPPG